MSAESVARLSERERQAVRVFAHQLHERFPGEILQTRLFGSKARGDSGPWSDIDITADLHIAGHCCLRMHIGSFVDHRLEAFEFVKHGV